MIDIKKFYDAVMAQDQQKAQMELIKCCSEATHELNKILCNEPYGAAPILAAMMEHTANALKKNFDPNDTGVYMLAKRSIVHIEVERVEK